MRSCARREVAARTDAALSLCAALYAQGHPTPASCRSRNVSWTRRRAWTRRGRARRSKNSFSSAAGSASRIAVCAQTIASAPGHPVGYFDAIPAIGRSAICSRRSMACETFQRLITQARIGISGRGSCRSCSTTRDSFVGDLTGAYGDAVKADIAESKTAGFDFSVSAPGGSHPIMRATTTSPRRAPFSRNTTSPTTACCCQPEYVTTTGPDLPNFYLLASLGDWAGARNALEVADRIRAGARQCERRAPYADLAVARLCLGANRTLCRRRRR